MFLCGNCKSTDKFDLFPSSDCDGDGNIEVISDKNGTLKISADNHFFTPDLSFMNEYAVCSYCGSIGLWEYSE